MILTRNNYYNSGSRKEKDKIHDEKGKKRYHNHNVCSLKLLIISLIATNLLHEISADCKLIGNSS